MIRQAEKKDIPQIVDVHLRALPDDLLPRLGRNYLLNELYPMIFDSNRTFNLVNDDNGLVNAFCIYAYDSKELTKLVTKNKLILAKYLSLCLLKDIRVLKEVIALIKGPNIDLISKDENFLDKGLPEIYIIATDPQYQKKGIGKDILATGFLSLIKEYPGCLVRTSAEIARDFYLRYGFSLFGFEYRGRRKFYLLIYNFQRN
jgi:ribosomal protein S18 acetylase RimI-like enzyme